MHEFGPPSVMSEEDVADLEPGPGEIVVDTRAVGVNPVDTYVRAGVYAKLPALPAIPGNDAAGVVRSVGEGVTGAPAPGDRVYVTGTTDPAPTGAYAEQVVCRPDQVKPLPDHVSFAQGAALGIPYATAWIALVAKAAAQPGETVFVHGASGAVGTAAVQMAKASGLTVIGTAGTKEGRAMVADQGADHVLDHTEAGYLDAVAEITGGRGPEVIVENLANVNLAADLAAVAHRGRVVVVGNRGTIEINPRALMAKDGILYGLQLWNATAQEIHRAFAAIGAGLASGTLRPVVGREFPLADAPRAHEAVLEPGAFGKIVLVPAV